MANWYGLGRTNYVRVRDRSALDAWLEAIEVDVEIYEKDDRLALSGYASDSGELPNWYEDEAGEERDDFLGDFVEAHLHPDDVLIYQSAGAEKARYATGFAAAYKVGQDPVTINIDTIYEAAAAAFGVATKDITQANY